MKAHKINFKPMLAIICIITIALCLTACDSGVECEYGIVVAKGEQMEYVMEQKEVGGHDLTVHPMKVGYYVQVLKCDENGELILDDNGNEQLSVYRTVEEQEFYKIYSGEVLELNESWWRY